MLRHATRFIRNVLLLVCSLCAVSSSYGQIGLQHVQQQQGGFWGPNGFTVLQEYASPFPGSDPDWTGFGFEYVSGNTYRYGGSYLDEGVHVYKVPYLAAPGIPNHPPLSRAEIASGAYPEFLLGQNYQLSGTFYFAIYTGYYDEDNWGSPLYDTEAFGWAKIQSSNGVLTMVDHAMEYSGAGLYIGTQTPLPEPSTLSVLAVGSLMIGLRRRRPNRI